MNGLVKVAWTNKHVAKSMKDYIEHSVDTFYNERLSTEETKRIMDYVKDKENLDIAIKFDPENKVIGESFFSPIDQNTLDKLKKLKDPGPLEKIKIDSYNGEKDGFIASTQTRSTLLHELGHAIDKKKNPNKFKWSGSGGILNDARNAGGFAGLTATALIGNQKISNEDGAREKAELTEEGLAEAALKGAALGTAIGVPISATGGLMVNRSENAANRYGKQILRGTNTANRTRELYPDFNKNIEFAKKTYTADALRQLKNVPLWAGTGAAAGLGLVGLTKGIEEMYNHPQD